MGDESARDITKRKEVATVSLCLSRDEIAGLTRCKLKAKQLEFLRRNGILHYIDAHGWPVVTRAAVEGGKDLEPPAPRWRSNKAID